jgi:hypothetical protein
MGDFYDPLPGNHSHTCAPPDEFDLPVKMRWQLIEVGRVCLLRSLAQLSSERLYPSNELKAIFIGVRNQRFKLSVLLVLVDAEPALHFRHEVIPVVDVVRRQEFPGFLAQEQRCNFVHLPCLQIS